MGGCAAIAPATGVLLPSAASAVAASGAVQGFSARPGRHSQTVFACALAGTSAAVSAASAAARLR